jgi:pantoate--beta-alanine ligase
VAYFGRKDYQQQLLIRRMCRDLDVPVEIRTCPTVREPDGLALSSRNAYLSPDERRSALALSQSLKLAQERLSAGDTDLSRIREVMRRHLETTPLITVDYATVAHPETLEEASHPLPELVALVAARVGATRLIDNMPLHLP